MLASLFKPSPDRRGVVVLDPKEAQAKRVVFEDCCRGGFGTNLLVLKPLQLSSSSSSSSLPFIEGRPLHIPQAPLRLVKQAGQNAHHIADLLEHLANVDGVLDTEDLSVSLRKNEAPQFFRLAFPAPSSAWSAFKAHLEDAQHKIERKLGDEEEHVIKPLLGQLRKEAHRRLVQTQPIQELLQLDRESEQSLNKLFAQ